jgi:acyl transferase domain-containing protein/glutamate-1-semialdehyde aminotransferase
MALAGGATVTCPPSSGYLYQEGAMLSPDGVTRAFDAAGKGTVFCDGVALVLLKRLEDALADGDTIYGVIKGAAINNDGAVKASFTAPSVDGQADVIQAAQDIAGFDPRSISYVEAHGTATPLGDPIELAALIQAFRRRTEDVGFCALGSVKTNVGHLVNAAGAAGLIKTALSLHFRQIPPSLYFTEPNPRLGLQTSPFYVNTRLAEWPENGVPRRAGVSSFGVGGTNAHVVLEEAPERPASGPSRPQKLLLLSARTVGALDVMTQRLKAHLAANPELDLADVAYTLMVGRKSFSHRRAFVAPDTPAAVGALEALNPLVVSTREVKAKAPDIAFLFPGQGAQYVRMGLGLYQSEPTYRAVVDYCSDVLRPILGRDLRELMYPKEGDEEGATLALGHTAITQPALFVTSYALAQLWISWGVGPKSMIGHSVGEFVAAALSGVMELKDALRLVAERGRLMGSQPAGAMLSVRLPSEAIADRLWGDMAVASDNGPNLCVVAGPTQDVAELQAQLTSEGVACRPLRTSHAFHSPMMDGVLGPFEGIVRTVRLSEPRIPFISTVTGTWITSSQALDPQYWARHLRATVRFRQGVGALLADERWALLEVGPRATLSTLARQQCADPARAIVASMSDDGSAGAEWSALLRAAARLWLQGVALDADAFHTHEQRRRVSLPTYPFERKRYWVDPIVPAADSRQLIAVDGVSAPPVSAPAVPQEGTMAQRFNDIQAAGGPPFAFTGAPVPYAPLPSPPPPQGAPCMSNSGRRELLYSKLRQVFEDVSGIELSESDNDTMFMELGLDSLLLTQISQQIQKTFQVKVTFRQLMESQPNLTTLSELLEEQMPKDLFADTPPAAPPQAPAQAPTAGGAGPGAVSPAVAPPAPSAGVQAPQGFPPFGYPYAPAAVGGGFQMPPAMGYPGSAYGYPPSMAGVPGGPPAWPAPGMLPQNPWGFDPRLVAMAQQQMAAWMAMMSQLQAAAAPQGWPTPGAPPPVPVPAAPSAPAPESPPGAPTADAGAPRTRPPVAGTSDGSDGANTNKSNVKQAFGAMARIHGAVSKDALTPRQKARLEALVRRYNAKTKSSKAFAQRNRARVADPRTVTGFRPEIKELVYPIVAKRSKGAYLWDLDDNRYIDTLNGFGACYFGWQPEFISEAVRAQLDASMAIGPQTPLVEEVAERFCRMTGHERAAFCNTGSEAVLGCMRTARTVTGRSTIAIFTGSYHGIFDEVIVRAIKNMKAYPAAPGILPNTAENVLVLDYGTDQSLQILRQRAQELAAVMVEPIQSRHPEIQPREFLQEVRRITNESGSAFIFDEVITGFRTGQKGAQGYYGIEADLASYGKVIGGGYSLGVIGGRSRFLDALDGGHWQFGDDSTPGAGVTYFAGTFVRHPLVLAAARAVLEYLEKEGPGLQERMNARTASLAQTLDQLFEELGVPLYMKHFSTLWQPYFREEQPYGDLFAWMLRDRDIHCYHGFPNFLTLAHTDADIEAIVNAYRGALNEMLEAEFLPTTRRRELTMDGSQPPVPGARLGRDPDGNPAWYAPDPAQPGSYVKVG